MCHDARQSCCRNPRRSIRAQSRNRVQKGCLIRRYKERVQASHAEGRKYPLFGTSLDDGTIGIDGSRPKPLHGAPSEMIVQDQIRESSIHVLLVGELIVHDPAIERSAGETRPSNEHVTRHVGGG